MKSLLVAFVLVFLSGVVLRFFQLGSVPTGLGWDEAAIGYNGWSIIQTRRDEWLHRLPLSFQSYGDYKAPLAIYINGFFTTVLGMNTFAVRLPFALASIVAIISWATFLRKLTRSYKLPAVVILYGVALLVFSPWHIVFSRIAFESGLSLALLLAAVALLWPPKTSTRMFSLIAGVLCVVLSMYAYHSAKLVAPIVFGMLLAVLRKKQDTPITKILLLSAIWLLCLIPLAFDALFGKGATRAGDLIFYSQDSFFKAVVSMFENIVLYLNPKYWYIGQLDSLRHVTGILGPIIPGTVVLAIMAIYSAISRRELRIPVTFFSTWFVAGLLPGILTLPAPHANRTLLALPGFLGLATIGFNSLLVTYRSNESKSHLASILGTLLLVQSLWVMAFVHDYFGAYRSRSALAFQAGYQDAINGAREELKKDPNAKVLLSSKYGQPYIYVLFFSKLSPIKYQQGALANYMFLDDVAFSDLDRPNTIVIYTPLDNAALQAPKEDTVIRLPEGSAAFYVHAPSK